MANDYHIAIVGAGIGGSCLAISMALKGYSVVLAEQHSYPKHKVCGEFLSRESEHYLKTLGLPLTEWNLPVIDQLLLTSSYGMKTRATLRTGGIGISRYKLDWELMKRMKELGVDVLENTKIIDAGSNFIKTNDRSISADIVVTAHGKFAPQYFKSMGADVDASSKDSMPLMKVRSTKNYVGVKYHLKIDLPPDEIALHSFPGGYCGVSQIEDEKYCFCYLVDASKLKKAKSIKELESSVLTRNKSLSDILNRAEKLIDPPISTSNILFGKRQTALSGILAVGDAAGCISPLSGNGMSMAARSAYQLSEILHKNSLSYGETVNEYDTWWNSAFKTRINRAKALNVIMLNPSLNHLTLYGLKVLSGVRKKVVESMQGESFG